MDALTNINSEDKKNNEELITTASSFWKFLDDLAITDPAAYAEFIYKTKQTPSESIMNANNNNNNKTDIIMKQFDKNIAIAQNALNGHATINKHFFTPIPFMVIKTKICETKTIVETLLNVNDYRNVMKKGQKLYVNFLESPYCKPLQSKSNKNNKITNKTPLCDILIPIQVSQLINEEQTDIYWRSDIIYHDSVYKRFNHNDNNNLQLFKKWIIEYAFRQIESQNSIKLTRNYKILKKKKFIGKTPPKPQFIQNSNKNKQNQKLEKKIKLEKNKVQTLKIEDEKTTNLLLIDVQNKYNKDDDKKINENINKIKDKNNEKNKCIMESKSYLIPKYTLNVDNKKKHIIKIIIEMEKENDIKDIELSVNETRLLLQSLYYKLDLIFPISVDDSNVKAKFDKKKHCLKLKFHLKQ